MPFFIVHKAKFDQCEKMHRIGKVLAGDALAAYEKALVMFVKNDDEILTITPQNKDKEEKLFAAVQNLVQFAKNSQCASIAKYANLMAMIEDIERILNDD